MREKLWREIFKCHQHKGGESITPAFRQKDWRVEGWDPRPGRGEGVLRGRLLGRSCCRRRSCCRQNLPSERGSCDRVATFSGCLHSLERQRCGNVTVVGGKWGATGMLPPVSSNITRRSSAVGHVGRHLGRGRIRSHAGC